MPDQVVSIGLEAQLGDLLADLQRAEGLTSEGAQKMVGNLQKTIIAAEKAQKSATKAAKDAAAGFKATEQNIGRSKEAIAQFGSALSVVSPELGGVVQQLGAVSGAAKAAASVAGTLGVSLGAVVAVALPLAAAIGGLVVWYQALQREQELSAALAETQRDATKSLEASNRALQDATIALSVATGEYTEQQGDAANASLKAQRAVLDLAAAQMAQRKALREQADSSEKWLSIAQSVDAVLAYTPARIAKVEGAWLGLDLTVTGAADALFGLRDKADNADAQLQILDDTIVKSGENQKQLRDITEKTTRAKRDHASASKAQAEAEKLASEAAKQAAEDRQEAEAEIADAIKNSQEILEEKWAKEAQLADIAAKAQEALLTPEQAETQEREKQLALIAQLAQETGDYTTARLASAAIIAKAEEEFERSAEERRKKSEEAAIQSTEMALAGLASVADGTVEILEGTGPAAKAAFAAWKALSYAAAVVQGYQAAVSAYASTVQIPYVGAILAPIAAATALAATGLQIKKIQATEMPTYHSGGTLAADEVQTVLTRQESVLTATGTERAGGREGVAALNRGDSAPQRLEVLMQYKHRIFDRFFQDYQRANPAPRTTRAGQRPR